MSGIDVPNAVCNSQHMEYLVKQWNVEQMSSEIVSRYEYVCFTFLKNLKAVWKSRLTLLFKWIS